MKTRTYEVELVSDGSNEHASVMGVVEFDRHLVLKGMRVASGSPFPMKGLKLTVHVGANLLVGCLPYDLFAGIGLRTEDTMGAISRLSYGRVEATSFGEPRPFRLTFTFVCEEVKGARARPRS